MTKRATSKRAELEARRERVASAYLRGVTQAQIAAQEGVNQAQISRDLTTLREAWQQSALVDIDELKAKELARIDELERTYWAEWEASKDIKETTATKSVQADRDVLKVVKAENKEGQQESQTVSVPLSSKRIEANVRKEERLGDPAYLRGVQWCIERRCAIVGIDAPKRSELTGKDGENLRIILGWSEDDSDLPFVES